MYIHYCVIYPSSYWECFFFY